MRWSDHFKAQADWTVRPHLPERLLMLRSRSGWFKNEARCAALLMNKGVTCVGAVGLFVLQNMVTNYEGLLVLWWCPFDFLVWFLRVQ